MKVEYHAVNMTQQELLLRYETMQEQASRDSLTGLLNRGALEREIKERLKTKPSEEACALFIVDLDNFKKINDTFGHQNGDEVLRRAASLLSEQFRASDVVGRLGGDEFVAFLSGEVNESMVRKKAQQICEQIQFVMETTPRLLVTASVGVHYLTEGTSEFRFMYKAADSALYKAKNAGKQRYCLVMDADAVEDAVPSKMKQMTALHLRMLLDSIDAGVALLDMRQPITFQYVSTALARMVDREGQSLTNTPALELFCPDDRQTVEHILREQVMARNETVSHMVRVPNRAGVPIWLRVHAVRIDDAGKEPVVLITAVDLTEIKGHPGAPEQPPLQAALDHPRQQIWEVDLPERTFRLLASKEPDSAELCEGISFPDGLVRKKWIEADSVAPFTAFANELLHGRVEGHANFKVRVIGTARYEWASFAYRIVYDEHEVPMKAIGLLEMMPSQEVKQANAKDTQLPKALSSAILLQARGSLSQDALLCYEAKGSNSEATPRRCTDLLEGEFRRIASPNDGRFALGYLSRQGLLRLYEERGNSWWMEEYQREDSEDTPPRWVCCTINLYTEAGSDDVMMSLWLYDVQDRRAREDQLSVSAGRHPLSNLYTLATAREIAARLLKRDENKQCALVQVDVDGLDRIGALDYRELERKAQALAYALRLAVSGGFVVGHLTLEQFVLFIPEIVRQEDVKERMEQALAFLRGVISDLVDVSLLRFLACGVCSYQDTANYDSLMRKARMLCAQWNNTSVDFVVFANQEEENVPYLKEMDDSDQIICQHDDVAHSLSEREKDAAFACLVEMCSATSLGDTSRCVLRALGEYYQADRAFILELSEKGSIVTVPVEWVAEQMKSVQETLTGRHVSAFPLIKRCIQENAPVFLNRQRKGNDAVSSSWRFAVFPMRDEQMIQCFLCVENGRNLMYDPTLPMLLSSCLLNERRKFVKPLRSVAQGGAVISVELPSYESYLDVIYTYTSDIYATLGVVCLDVPYYPAIINHRGVAYGQKMMWEIGRTLADVFGRDMIFRTWDAGFVVLCPNTTPQVFSGKCERLRGRLARCYPGDIRMGKAWSDTSFEGKDLVEEAKVLMRCDASRL